MKKIEKEEQLKKKLEQTTEEKMAADSKTVEGESAVVKAEEGNTVTEQEPEAAPALSEEELKSRSPCRSRTRVPPDGSRSLFSAFLNLPYLYSVLI